MKKYAANRENSPQDSKNHKEAQTNEDHHEARKEDVTLTLLTV